MSDKNKESLLWQKVKKGLTDCFLTRIESSTINGIPDIHGVSKFGVFWVELKSDDSNYPKLNKWQVVWINRYDKTLSKRCLKLYRPVSVFTDPRSLKPRSSFSFPYHWPTVQQQLVKELVQPEAEEQELVLVSRPC
jgi:hypothetical protein